MAQQTKNAIRRAFIQLLNERPLDKISIKDIAEKGAVNRNTFYYYYADIYALVEDILQLEIQDFQSKLRRYDSWQEAFRDATAFASQNKRAVYHLYNSGNQETLRRYYHKVTLAAMTSYIRDQAEGLPADDEDIRVLSEFYAAALSGLTALWLQNGMKYDTDAVTPLRNIIALQSTLCLIMRIRFHQFALSTHGFLTIFIRVIKI